MRHAEDAIQIGIVDFLRIVLPRDQYRVAAIPNGGFRTKAEGRIMKLTGTLAGMPDLMIFGAGGKCFFIEVKAEKGRLEPEQAEMRDWMNACGVPCAVARSIDDARAALKAWGLPTREVGGARAGLVLA